MKKLIIFLLVITQAGCSSVTYRTNGKFDGYFNERKKVAVLTPDMKIFKLTAGGADLFQDEWSAKATDRMRQELQKELNTFDTIQFEYLDKLSGSHKEFLDEQNGIFYTVSHSVVAHTYEPGTTFPHKIKNFDYTLGSEMGRLKDFTDAEAVLFVNGRNYIWTAGRSSLAVLSFLVGAATGVYVQIPAGKEWLTAALVDVNSGDILWFNYLPMPGDMRMGSVDLRLTKLLFRDFPKEWRNPEKWEQRKEEREVAENE